MLAKIAAIALLLSASPAMAQERALLDRAVDAAFDTFERVLPRLGASEFGVDVAAYRDALTLHRFSSAVWGGTVDVELDMRASATGSCSQFAAFVRVPPENGRVKLVACPKFFTPGADGLRELTILHEMVHVVAGTNECQAMAFAAKVQQLATGTYTPVEAYWRASGCVGTAYRLPD